jgi:hypothetical protein
VTLGRVALGTQYRSVGKAPMRLYPVDPVVTDDLRGALKVAALAEARRRETEMSRSPAGG